MPRPVEHREHISTHSPRAGRTRHRVPRFVIERHFNSLAPCGANRYALQPPGRGDNFNSLAPCGANQFLLAQVVIWNLFQLTRPVRGEPDETIRFFRQFSISTHSPRAGRTCQYWRAGYYQSHFNSLAPCGANLFVVVAVRVKINFNSLAPCGANR